MLNCIFQKLCQFDKMLIMNLLCKNMLLKLSDFGQSEYAFGHSRMKVNDFTIVQIGFLDKRTYIWKRSDKL